MAELAQITQGGGLDPRSGSPLSAENRKSIFQRSLISSNVFGGGNLPPISRNPISENSSIVQSQSATITSLQGQVNSLKSEIGTLNAVVSSQTQNLNGIQEQIGGLRTEVANFGAPLMNVTKSINNDAVLEQNQIKQQEELQRRAAEEELRTGRERTLEKSLQNALVAPVQKVAAKAQNILGSLSQLFSTLLLGWLTNQGIETLRAASSNNRRKLEDIKRNVLQSLGVGAAILLALNGGFLRIAGTIANLGLKIAGWIGKNTIGRFFGAVGDILKNLGKAAPAAAAAGVGAAAASTADDAARAGASAAASTADDAARAGTSAGARGAGAAGARGAGAAGAIDDVARAAAGSADDVARAAATRGGGLLSTLGKLAGPFNIAAAGVRYSLGDTPGAVLSAGSAIPVLGWGFAGVDIAREFGAFEGTFLGKNQTQTQTPAATPTPTPAATPKPNEGAINPPFTLIGNLEENIPAPTPAATPTPTPAEVQPQEQLVPTPTLTQQETSAVQPQTPAIPPPSPEMEKNFQMAWDYRNRGFARGQIETAWNNMTDEQQQQAKIWAQSKGYDWNEMKLNMRSPQVSEQSISIQNYENMSIEELKKQLDPTITGASNAAVFEASQRARKEGESAGLTGEELERKVLAATVAATKAPPPSPAQTDKIPSALPGVGPEPTPPPNVIYANGGGSGQQQSNAQPNAGGPVNEAPSISASNPDNFYVLYSRINYNVVG